MYSPRQVSSWWRMASLLVVVSLLAACGGSATQPAASSPENASGTASGADQTASAVSKRGSLSVLEWAGYELPEFWQPFAQQYPNVSPEYSFFTEDAEAFAKLQSGFKVDLMHPCSPWWNLYVQEGLVQPIDTSRLKNWGGIDARMAEMGKINGQQYFVPWDWGYESILVRTDKVKTVPSSWADLTKPEYAGHLALWDSGEANHIISALAQGLDPWDVSPGQEQEIQQWLIDLKPNLLTYWVDFSELAQMMASGDVWVAANAWPDTYRTLLDQGVPVEYVEPKEGKLGFVCGFGISQDAADLDAAHAYIDAMIAPESMAAFANMYGYGAANRDALPQIDPGVVELLQLDDPNVMDRTVFYRSLTSDQRQQITSMWNEVKAAP